MPELSASLGLAYLEEFDAILAKKKAIAERDAARRRNTEEIAKAEFAGRSAVGRTLLVASKSLDLLKTTSSIGDLSATGRQGIVFTLSSALFNPQQFFGRWVPYMVKSARSEQFYGEIIESIRRHKLYAQAVEDGVDIRDPEANINNREEIMRSKIAEALPAGIGKVVRGSNRAFTVFLHLQRMDKYAEMIESHPGGITKEERMAIASLVNIATGRGDTQFMGSKSRTITNLANAFGAVLWAPKLYLSRMQLLLMPLRLANPLMDPVAAKNKVANNAGLTRSVKKLIAKEYAKSLTGALALYALFSMAKAIWDDDDEMSLTFDPRSTDFGRMRFGNTRVDPLGGISQFAVLAARLASGEKVNAKGKVVEIRGENVPYGGDTPPALLGRMLRTKLTPGLGILLDMFSYENVVGERVTLPSTLAQIGVPLTVRDIYSHLRDNGVPAGTAYGLLSIFGFGVNTYDANDRKTSRPLPAPIFQR